jgi:hypothetical protein
MDNYGGENTPKIPKKIKFMDNYRGKNTQKIKFMDNYRGKNTQKIPCEGAKSCLFPLFSFSFLFLGSQGRENLLRTQGLKMIGK